MRPSRTFAAPSRMSSLTSIAINCSRAITRSRSDSASRCFPQCATKTLSGQEISVGDHYLGFCRSDRGKVSALDVMAMAEIVPYQKRRPQVAGRLGSRARTDRCRPAAPHVSPGRSYPRRPNCDVHIPDQRALHPHRVVETWMVRRRNIDVADNVDPSAKPDLRVDYREFPVHAPQTRSPQSEQ